MSKPSTRVTVATALLAAGTAWNGGNIGPVTATLSEDFSVSLAAVGLLSGTVFFAGLLATTILAPAIGKRTGVARAARLGCILCGAGVTLGMAAALGVRSVLEDAGVDRRIAFVVSAGAGVLALPFLPARMESEAPDRHPGRLLGAMLRSIPLFRVGLVYVGSFGVQLIVGAWLIHYLTQGDGMEVSLAGLLAFVMFGVSAAARDLGGTLAARGVSPVVLVGIAPLLATAGLVMVAADRSFEVALPAIVLMGVGFSTPYAVMMDEAQRLFP